MDQDRGPDRKSDELKPLMSKMFNMGSKAALSAFFFVLLFATAPHGASAGGDVDPVAVMVAKVSPAVVRIVTVRPVKKDPEQTGAKVVANAVEGTSVATGSGFIVDPSGYVATNKHVIDGAISVFVVAADGVRYSVTAATMPAEADMALLKIDVGRPLPYLQLGDSDKMSPGERVIAIGSPFGFDTSVSTGVVSAVNRDIMESPFDDYIQTDAAINHGNSGGPLFNLAGEVIGMTSVIFAPGSGSAGVGFALPSNSLRFVFDRLIKTGKVEAGMLPLHTQQVTWMLQRALDAPDNQGAMVTSVQDDDEKMLQGKIRPGDVIRTFDGEKVLDPRDLARKAAMKPVGSDAKLGIYQAGKTEMVNVTIQAWPEAKPLVLNPERHRPLGLDLTSGDGENRQPIVAVAAVDPAGTAAGSGIQKGDRIVEVDGEAVSDPNQAKRIFQIRSSQFHDFSAVLIERDRKLFWIPVAVAVPE